MKYTQLLVMASTLALSGASFAQSTEIIRSWDDGTTDGLNGTPSPGIPAVWNFGSGDIVANGIAYDGTSLYGIFQTDTQGRIVNLSTGTELLGLQTLGLNRSRGLAISYGNIYRLVDGGAIESLSGAPSPGISAVWNFGSGDIVANDIAYDGTNFYGLFQTDTRGRIVNLSTGTELPGLQALGLNRSSGLAIHTTAPVPEPSSAALLGLGGLALILRRRK